VPIGVYYRAEGVPTYQDGLPQFDRPAWKRALEPPDLSGALKAFM
jgi:hypothetical protein